MDARKIISLAENYNGLPFTERWIVDSGISQFKTMIALRELRERGVLYDYSVLREVAKGLVSQFEHTVIVKDTPIVTTR
jgi:methionyl aminopeptidase